MSRRLLLYLLICSENNAAFLERKNTIHEHFNESWRVVTAEAQLRLPLNHVLGLFHYLRLPKLWTDAFDGYITVADREIDTDQLMTNPRLHAKKKLQNYFT